MIDTFVTIFQSDTCLASICFGPILLAAVLIGLHYVGLWRLNRQPRLDSRRIERYRMASGLVILAILLSPVPLWATHYIVSETIVFPMQLSQTRSDADELVQAIESFHTRTGRYPSTLDELVPVELESVPVLSGQIPFTYESGADWYSLRYGYRGIAPVTCTYHSGSIGWYCD